MCNVVASQPFPTVPQYHLIDRALTWPEARSFCMLKYTDLATVNNMFDKNRLVNVVGNRVAFAWIGLYNSGHKRWMWSDGDGRAFFTRWKEGEPNNLYGDERCGEMSETGEWNDKLCGDEKAFVCYQREYGTQRDNVNVLSSTWIYSSYQFCFVLRAEIHSCCHHLHVGFHRSVGWREQLHVLLREKELGQQSRALQKQTHRLGHCKKSGTEFGGRGHH